MKTNVYNQSGEKMEEIELPKEIFEVSVNPDLIHQVVVNQLANQRQMIAHTKTRAEVRGGGKKPWRQKGTGRARHGSRRSPIWRGGGVTFGPTKERNFKKESPKKMRRKALMMVLSAKAKNNLLFILDKLNLEQPKTKLIVEIIKKILKKGDSCLIALPKKEENIIRATNNLPKVQTIEVRNLNCLELLSYKYLVMPKEAIKVIEETFKIKSKR
jgi:large subunit ribosomal protein L4